MSKRPIIEGSSDALLANVPGPYRTRPRPKLGSSVLGGDVGGVIGDYGLRTEI